MTLTEARMPTANEIQRKPDASVTTSTYRLTCEAGLQGLKRGKGTMMTTTMIWTVSSSGTRRRKQDLVDQSRRYRTSACGPLYR